MPDVRSYFTNSWLRARVVLTRITMNMLREDRATRILEIIEPNPEEYPILSSPPDLPFRYRLLNENLHDPSDLKAKFIHKWDVSAMSPSRSKILELLRPEDPGRDALEAIVKPVPRRGLTRPLDEDTKRFLQRALQSPSYITNSSQLRNLSQKNECDSTESTPKSVNAVTDRSLAEELREAEEDEQSGGHIKRELLREFRRRKSLGIRESVERDRLGKLALSVEQDEDENDGLCAVARRIDALLAESRDLHEELVGIQEDLQPIESARDESFDLKEILNEIATFKLIDFDTAQSARACRCTAAARALSAESHALRYLDDVVALLRGDVAAANRAKAWPFAIGRRQPGRNYVI